MPPTDPTPTTPPLTPPRRGMRAPSGRRFAAGALASVVAVFGVLALRVHAGDDPALANVSGTKATTSTTSGTDSSSNTTTDPYTSGDDSSSSTSTSGDDGSSSNDQGSVSSTPSGSTSAS